MESFIRQVIPYVNKLEYKRESAVNKAERAWNIFIPQVNNSLSAGGRNKPYRWNIIKTSGF